jgi:phage terminase small subunit
MAKRRQATSLDPPHHLSDRSKAIWRAIVPRRAKSTGRLVMLELALKTLDLADKTRTQVEQEGFSTTTPKTGMVHVHPLLKVQREAEKDFVKMWKALNLEWTLDSDGAINSEWKDMPGVGLPG